MYNLHRNRRKQLHWAKTCNDFSKVLALALSVSLTFSLTRLFYTLSFYPFQFTLSFSFSFSLLSFSLLIFSLFYPLSLPLSSSADAFYHSLFAFCILHLASDSKVRLLFMIHNCFLQMFQMNFHISWREIDTNEHIHIQPSQTNAMHKWFALE